MGLEIILASGSPRRAELLAGAGIAHRVVVSGADETIDGPPDMQVLELARRKAYTVQPQIDSPHIIIAADTIVYLDGQVLGKPDGPAGAFAMLSKMSGRRHTVYTGVALLRHDGEIMNFQCHTDVVFRALTAREIQDYVDTGEPLDKSGSYGVQDLGARLVAAVDGDVTTVMGLPVAPTLEALNDMRNR
jgi:septum formation protein